LVEDMDHQGMWQDARNKMRAPPSTIELCKRFAEERIKNTPPKHEKIYQIISFAEGG